MTKWSKVAPLDKTCLSDGDYTLTDGCAWFEVEVFAGKSFAIRIAKTDDGVAVDIYQDGREDEDALASCYALDGDIEEDEICTKDALVQGELCNCEACTQDTLPCECCGRPVAADDTVWIHPVTRKATTDGAPYHVECGPGELCDECGSPLGPVDMGPVCGCDKEEEN
jgi:hypothetical protein